MFNAPQKNGVVKHKHQHILNVARSLFFQSHIPKNFWHLSIAHVVHIINRLPSSLLNNNTLYYFLFKNHPDYDNFKSFGCFAYASALQHNRRKFDPRSKGCVFPRYKEGTKCYLLFDLATNTFFVSRNVFFYESCFPFMTSRDPRPLPPIPIIHYDISELEPITITIPNPTNPHTSPPHNIHDHTNDHILPTINSNTCIPSSPLSHYHKKSTYISKNPSYLIDYHCNLMHTQFLPNYIFSTTTFPLSSVLTYDHYNTTYKNFCVSISPHPNPPSSLKPVNMNVGSRPCNMRFKPLSTLILGPLWTFLRIKSNRM